jgi:hypothetical protein
MRTNIWLEVICATFFVAFCSSDLHTQESDPDDPTGAIRSQLTQVVHTQFGNDYDVAFIVLDSAIAKNQSTSDYGELSDPYGTLKGYILFGADKEATGDDGHGIMGFFKDGRIVWNSDSVFTGSWYGIYSVQDINRDGKVDLLVEWTPGSQLIMVRHLWIVSWDGSNGSVINQVSAMDGNTTIHSAENMFEVIAADTTSPLVIRGRWPGEENFSDYFPNTQIATFPYVTYSWNGSQYGLWPETRQVPGNEFTRANLLTVDVKCRVSKLQDSVSFQYFWSNEKSSKQHMASFALAGVKKSFEAINPPHWIFYGWWKDYPIAAWEVEGLRAFNKCIPPDESQSGITIHANALPAIVKFYIQGCRQYPDFGRDRSGFKTAFETDFFNDSFVGLTVGPIDPPSQFMGLLFLDTMSSYASESRALGWIKDETTANKYLGYFNSAKSSLQENNIAAVRTTLGQVLNDVNVDSTSNLTSEAYALIRYNTEYLLSQLPTNPASGMGVRLINSGGTTLTGGSLQYYEGNWKNAVNNNDGSFTVNTSLATVSLRMTYAYGSQTKSNIPVNGGSVTFQTVNTQVKLQNSQGVAIDTGSVQYYAGAWRPFGTTSNGITSMELLPANYSLRMTYAFGSNDKQQDIGVNPIVVFQTVNNAVQLKNSQSTLIDQGTVQYYAGAWRDFGATTNGVAIRELLPANYSFRMTYAYASKDKQQNIGTNPTVVFNTVNAAVELRNSLGNLIDQGSVQYYAGAWRSFGTTTHGTATKELLANNYTFRMTYETVSNDKQQDIGTNSTVSFSTVLCTVRVANATGQQVSGAVVSYYSGSWRVIGPTANGDITKELLPANLTFRISYGGRTQDKVQNLSTNPVVEFVAQ